MKLVIVGGGKVGYYLVKTLLSMNHQVILIEKRKERCEDLADELSIPTCHGDATKVNVLKSAGAMHADIFIAVTGMDEENLVACQLAKTNLYVSKTIARVNNPKNEAIFSRLGVDMTVNSTTIISDLIEEAVDYDCIQTLTKLKDGRIIILEVEIRKSSPSHGKALQRIAFPPEIQLISIMRDGAVWKPEPDFVLQAGDTLVVASDATGKVKLKRLFIG